MLCQFDRIVYDIMEGSQGYPKSKKCQNLICSSGSYARTGFNCGIVVIVNSLNNRPGGSPVLWTQTAIALANQQVHCFHYTAKTCPALVVSEVCILLLYSFSPLASYPAIQSIFLAMAG